MIEKFIQENIGRDIKNFETMNDLYKRYLKFCGFYKSEPLTIVKFGNQLSKSNVGVRHRRMKNWKKETGRWGVKLLPCKY